MDIRASEISDILKIVETIQAEGGIITIFDERGRNLAKIGEGFFAANAHSVAVDQRTHLVADLPTHHARTDRRYLARDLEARQGECPGGGG